jgi:hypothetical protein
VAVAVALAVADSRRWIRKNNVKSHQWVDALLTAVAGAVVVTLRSIANSFFLHRKFKGWLKSRPLL